MAPPRAPTLRRAASEGRALRRGAGVSRLLTATAARFRNFRSTKPQDVRMDRNGRESDVFRTTPRLERAALQAMEPVSRSKKKLTTQVGSSKGAHGSPATVIARRQMAGEQANNAQHQAIEKIFVGSLDEADELLAEAQRAQREWQSEAALLRSKLAEATKQLAAMKRKNLSSANLLQQQSTLLQESQEQIEAHDITAAQERQKRQSQAKELSDLKEREQQQREEFERLRDGQAKELSELREDARAKEDQLGQIAKAKKDDVAAQKAADEARAARELIVCTQVEQLRNQLSCLEKINPAEAEKMRRRCVWTASSWLESLDVLVDLAAQLIARVNASLPSLGAEDVVDGQTSLSHCLSSVSIACWILLPTQ